MSTFLERAEALLNEARAELERIEAERAELAGAAQKVRNFIRAVEGPQQRSKPAERTARRITDSRVLLIAHSILESDAENRTFAQREIAELTGAPSGTMSLAFKRLREIEFLAKVGRDGNRDLYRVLDAESLGRLNADG